MFKSRRFLGTSIRLLAAATFIVTMTAYDVSEGWAGRNLNRSSVGGVFVDVEGVVGQPRVEGLETLGKERMEQMERIAEGISGTSAIRSISLKRLEAKIAQILENRISGTPFDLPDAVR